MTESTAKKQTLPQADRSGSSLTKAKNIQFSALIKNDKVQKSLSETLGDSMKTKTFTSSLISAVSTNPALRDCDGMTIISAALLGESLNLSPSPQLGQYYLVPFKDTKNQKTNAVFVLGYKGFYQLALRSGQYKSLDAVEIKEGELKSYNAITGEVELDPIDDPEERENAKTIGYYAWFELLNGFKKSMYWSKKKMEAHASKYSKGYAAHKGYTFWEKDFDSMAKKTMLRQLISHYGIMSIDMQKAYINDNTYHETLDQNDEPVYFDNPGTTFDAETGEVTE